MEGRMRRYGAQLSPERSKMWTEPSPKHPTQRQQGRKVPVVYYLCKNRHLEHPHFIEVPFTSPDGLYLRDVINRLVALRGKRLPTLYSWSCKRGYKNGFVWQDLSEDDLILPAHGNEYILKGSELLDQTPDRLQDSNINSRVQNHALPQPVPSTCSRAQEASSFCSSPASMVKEGTPPSPPPPPPPPQPYLLEADNPPQHQSSSPEIGSPSFGECQVFIQNGAQDASTQTEDGGVRTKEPNTQTMGASTDDGFNNSKFNRSQQNLPSPSNDAVKEISPRSTPSNTASGGKIDTLEMLLRAEVSKLNSFRIIEEGEVVSMKAEVKRTNPLLKLITCGSTLVKDHHSFGFIPTYKPRFSNVRLSPSFPSSMLVRELDHISESSRMIRLGPEERDISTRSVVENHALHKDEGEASPSNNFYAFYSGYSDLKSLDSEKKDRASHLADSKYSPPMQNSSCRQGTSGTFSSPVVDIRSTLATLDDSKSPYMQSLGGSKRMADMTLSKGLPTRVEAFEEKTQMIKIEESLLQELGS
ncbi:hypothetical protein AXF42_Ash002014 [Apostasia shenzhenica]|uniref:SOSEKI DIX-like domain-containing protein n=1 Tax=Apostasia shenzhenica TaxID=1088818 RepID=A0A2I0ABV4_9ASPA|nr:hypothetical protein AXF42_Ash002014 [Apostasia shenzhenica]